VRFEFLGTGSSAGIPIIGCDCGVCTSADPRDTRLRTSACLRFTDPQGQARVILIDASPDLRQQALRSRLERVDAILFTHHHADHVFGLDEVRRFNVLMQQPIPIFADRHTLDALRRVYAYIFDRHANVQDSFIASIIAHEIRPHTPLELFGLRVTPIPLLHGRLPILGFRFDPAPRGPTGPLPLAYCTDVSGIPPESWPHFQQLETLVLDGLRHRKHPTHFTIGQAVNAAENIAAAQTYLVHMSHDIAHEPTNNALPTTIHLAYDGLVLDSCASTPDDGVQKPVSDR
jgi:phosphoribosyl 1,2-cyclic phosphate phosphodiesterase